MANEREMVSSHLYHCTKNFASSCLAKERVLFSLKMPADAKKLPYSMFVQIFQVSNLKVMVE